MEKNVLNFTKGDDMNPKKIIQEFVKLHDTYGIYNPYKLQKNKIYIYNIPQDIFEYIYFNNGKIKLKDNYPKELEEKLIYCKCYIEIDLNFYLTFSGLSVIGGKDIGIKNKKGKYPSLLTIKISNQNKIGLFDDYDYIHNYCKLIDLENGKQTIQNTIRSNRI